MSTKLRLLLDECVSGPIVDEIRDGPGILSVEAITGEHRLANRGTLDEDVVAYATRLNRVLVTTETRLDEKKYPVCTHSGIIAIKATRRSEVERAKLFTRFMLSGHRNAAKHAVTKLRLDNDCVRIERALDGRLFKIVFRL